MYFDVLYTAVEISVQRDKDSFSLSRVRDQAVQTVRTLMRLAETLKPVPEDHYISIKLFYYDELTPQDYHPPGFNDATNEEHQFFREAPLKVNVGNVSSVSPRRVYTE